MEDSRLGDTEAAHGGACIQVHIGLYPGGRVNEESLGTELLLANTRTKVNYET